MTVEKENKAEEEINSCVLVGIQIDENGKELLNYALNNAIEEGDRVVALYISRSSDLGTSTQTSIKALNNFLVEFEELCRSKKVTLTGRVARGISIRRTIVKEAAQCNAKKVIVGRNTNIALGCSASVAKYCLKKLPPTTTLIAFHNGEVFLQRLSQKPSHQAETPKQNLGSILHPNIGLSAEDNDEYENDRCLIVVRKQPEIKPGWPLLRKAINANMETSKETEARKMSVVQWVMNLPDRSSLSVKSPTSDLINELETILSKNSSTCKWFQYEELQLATNYFSKDYLIGEGGSSRVYKGCLANGEKIAIKLSKLSNETSKDFLLEADIITKLQHERIVPLLGICVECNTFLSIYGYFSKGSLEENIHGNKVKTPLAWDKRFKIAVGVAEALNYLHTGSSESVVHRDVKSSNILLNDKFEPQLSDFGLAVWAPKNPSSQTQSDIVGTFGYLAPEYFMYGKVSSKIDVYAYGVVLLELLTGRKPISDDSPKGQESLVMWAIPRLEKGDLSEFLDPNINGNFEEKQVRRMIKVSSLCITRTARLRPQMSQVLSLLKGEEEVQTWLNSKSIMECQDEEAYPSSSIGSHLELALLDVEEDDASEISFEQNQLNSLDDYLRERWSRSSSFD